MLEHHAAPRPASRPATDRGSPTRQAPCPARAWPPRVARFLPPLSDASSRPPLAARLLRRPCPLSRLPQRPSASSPSPLAPIKGGSSSPPCPRARTRWPLLARPRRHRSAITAAVRPLTPSPSSTPPQPDPMAQAEPLNRLPSSY
jgi:hypothetical protein